MKFLDGNNFKLTVAGRVVLLSVILLEVLGGCACGYCGLSGDGGDGGAIYIVIMVLWF